MTTTQRRKLNKIFSDVVKHNIIWGRSANIAAIFGGRRSGPDILVALHNAWIEYMENEDLEPWDWEIPILYFVRDGVWLGLAMPLDNRWTPCGAPPRRGGIRPAYTEDALRSRI